MILWFYDGPVPAVWSTQFNKHDVDHDVDAATGAQVSSHSRAKRRRGKGGGQLQQVEPWTVRIWEKWPLNTTKTYKNIKHVEHEDIVTRRTCNILNNFEHNWTISINDHRIVGLIYTSSNSNRVFLAEAVCRFLHVAVAQLQWFGGQPGIDRFLVKTTLEGNQQI